MNTVHIQYIRIVETVGQRDKLWSTVIIAYWFREEKPVYYDQIKYVVLTLVFLFSFKGQFFIQIINKSVGWDKEMSNKADTICSQRDDVLSRRSREKREQKCKRRFWSQNPETSLLLKHKKTLFTQYFFKKIIHLVFLKSTLISSDVNLAQIHWIKTAEFMHSHVHSQGYSNLLLCRSRKLNFPSMLLLPIFFLKKNFYEKKNIFYFHKFSFIFINNQMINLWKITSQCITL